MGNRVRILGKLKLHIVFRSQNCDTIRTGGGM